MTSKPLSRWMMPGLLAAGLAAAALVPAPAQAQSGDDLARVIVDVADVVLRGNQPYYRGNYDDRLRVAYDHRGRPTYYRVAPRHDQRYAARHHRKGPPRHAPAHGYRAKQVRRESCDRRGRCTVQYYDPGRDRSNRWR